MRFYLIAILLPLILTACEGAGSPESSSSTVSSNSLSGTAVPGLIGGFPSLTTPPLNNSQITSCSQAAQISAQSTITGVVEYERIPIGLSGLDYNARANLPARGVIVEAVDASFGECSETVLTTTLTNANGQYGLNVPVNQSVCVQVRAQLFRDGGNGGGEWNIQVTDNTLDNAAYYLVDETIATPNDNNVRNFLAASGAPIGSSDYLDARAAAPFAILDTLCESIESLVSVDSQIKLPSLQVHWSVDNVASSGDVKEGEIGGAFFRKQRTLDQDGNVLAVANEMFLLGDEDNNTDEYDAHVISHEFGHFIINNLSRSDAFGGAHGLSDLLDMRVAFDEGWADAFAGIVLESASKALLVSPEIYRDSLGNDQDYAFNFNLSNNITTSAGWYSEPSVFSIVYNLFDSANSGADNISMGLKPIYDVLTSDAFKNTDAFITIFSFINHLKKNSSDDFAIDALMAAEDFESINDDFGVDENISNNNLPSFEDVEFIYASLLQNSTKIVCSNNQFGVDNKLSVRQYLTFDADMEKNYKFSVSPTPGAFADGQVLFRVFQKGEVVIEKQANSPGQSVTVEKMLNGRYVLSLSAIANTDSDSAGIGRRCFAVSVE